MLNVIEEVTQNKQVKSKERVAEYAEVFTHEREVNAMLDLVKQETERVDSRFLEPACGNGNFLAEVLKRKLSVVAARYAKSRVEWERYAAIATGSIYGIDLLEDNVAECRGRLFGLFNEQYTRLFKTSCKDDYRRTIKFILFKNIIRGNALTMRTEGLLSCPIVFPEWSLITSSLIQRRDFAFQSLLENQMIDGPNLFSDLGEEALIANPVKTHPPTHLMKLAENEQYEL